MERSRADRILGDWDRISRQASRPGLPARGAVTSALPARTITAAALLVTIVVATGLWFGLPQGPGPSAPTASPSPVEPSASPVAAWGPLAVIPPQDGADTARTEGTLRITDTCVVLEFRGEVTLLFWPADRTTWSPESQTITFANFDGSVVTVGDGDAVVLGGSGDSEAESGLSGEEWIGRMTWVAPPAPSCPLDTRWGVGAVELAEAAEPEASPLTTATEAAGLKLIATFDRLGVEAGGTVTVALSIENTRPTDVVFEEPCDVEAMTVELRAPVEPIGREWDGIAAAFKTYTLEQSAGSPMESSIRTPVLTIADALPCHATRREPVGSLPTAIIEAGATYETELTWTAEIVNGLPAAPGAAPFSIKVLYDSETVAGGMTSAQTLETTGTITVLDGATGAVSAGVAIDAALGDPEFATWLAKQPQDSWANVNLLLQPRAFRVDVLPEVPYWDIELYREPRDWAVLFVDAVSGEVIGRIFCNTPCDR
jgi:hypothetical protein